MSNDLPPPILIRPGHVDEVYGRRYLVPVALEGYAEGYNSTVIDEYEPCYGYQCVLGGAVELIGVRLEFVRRVRQFSKPLHEGRCNVCEAYWALTPDKPDEVLAEADHDD